MDESTPPDFEADGLPAFSWDESAWLASDVLRSWAGWQSRGGAYGAKDAHSPSPGRVRVSIHTRFDRFANPHPSQLAAYRHLRSHEADIAKAIRDATFAVYPDLRDEWLRHRPDALLPVLAKPEELSQVMGLHDVHILAIEKDGLAYVGFEFGCNWEDEHGFGVLTHGLRVIETGEASVSFSPSAAATKDSARKIDPGPG